MDNQQKQPSPKFLNQLPHALANDPIVGTAEAAAAVNPSPVHIRRLVRAGKFPPPLRIGCRKMGWRTSTITKYIEAREKIANSAFT